MIWIYGDSYLDDQYKNESKIVPWFERFGPTRNFAKKGTGPQYAFKHFHNTEKDIRENDIIIFCLSEITRINWLELVETEWGDSEISSSSELSFDLEQGMFIHSDNILDKVDLKFARKFYETFYDELEKLNEKNVSYLSFLTDEKKCNCFIILHDRLTRNMNNLNRKNFYVHDRSMHEISYVEGTLEHMEYKNHLSTEKHDIMENVLSDFLNDDLKDLTHYWGELAPKSNKKFIYQ